MKERILIVNKFYYRRGGDCICTLNLERLLKAKGHDVAIFAMQFPENLPSAWQQYWPGEISFNGGAGALARSMQRTFGYGDVRKLFLRMLNDFRPDVVHLNNIHSYLSPIVGKLAHDFGAKVVWTLHDYKLICPVYTCTRDGKPCELCFNNKINVLSHRCMKGSLAASGIAWLEALRWNRKRLEKSTDLFICPSQFMAQKLEQAGYAKDKIASLTNFVAPEMIESYADSNPDGKRGEYYCYVGRLSEEKGIGTLLEAAANLPYKLKVAGGGPMEEDLKNRYGNHPNIEFMGHLGGEEVRALLNGAKFSVIPSEWYENNPLSVIESLCAGTPVVGARIGGIPELVADGNGMTFESGNRASLTKAISDAMTATFDNKAIQSRAMKKFSPDSHYSKLIELYSRIS